MHKPTLFAQPACIYIGRFVSFMFLELHASQLSQQPRGLGLKNQKAEI